MRARARLRTGVCLSIRTLGRARVGTYVRAYPVTWDKRMWQYKREVSFYNLRTRTSGLARIGLAVAFG